MRRAKLDATDRHAEACSGSEVVLILRYPARSASMAGDPRRIDWQSSVATPDRAIAYETNHSKIATTDWLREVVRLWRSHVT